MIDRPQVAFGPDWDDVLRRAAPAPRRSRRVAAVACCAAALAAAAAAASTPGVRNGLLSVFDLARSPRAAASWHLAGPPVHPTAQLRAAARLTHVAPASIRRITAGGSGYRRLVLVGGVGPDRQPWLAQLGSGWASDFFPLFGALDEFNRPMWRTRTAHGWDGREFPMYARSDEHRATFAYTLFGGTEADRVDWATVVGFVRSDVARLVVVTRDGARRTIPLDRRGAYTYAAVRPAALPRTLIAFDASGRLLGRETLALPTFS